MLWQKEKEQDWGIGRSGWGLGAELNEVVQVGLTRQVMLEQRLEGSEGEIPVGT